MSSKGSLSGFSPLLRVVLGPTNTGKTHLAMERLLAHQSGMIGLPLRLLAREVYERCLKGDFGRVHKADIALITGEEKILPPKARYFICTTEAMPVSREVEFIAIDECQLAAD
jgi:ATP-dependent RNA helicase SUPV3L1/SUV3